MYYSVVKIDGDVVYLDADGMQVCASLDKFNGEIHETDLVIWLDGMFTPDRNLTEQTQAELYTKAQKIAKNNSL